MSGREVTTAKAVNKINYTSMGILLWILFGGIIGWIASLIMNTDAEQGLVLNVLVGVVGAVAGGWLMSIIGETGVTGFNLYSFVVALIGSVALLSLIKMLRLA